LLENRVLSSMFQPLFRNRYVPMAEDKGQAQKAGQSSRANGRGNGNAGPSKTSKKSQSSGPKVLG
jgi:hypothetical protein